MNTYTYTIYDANPTECGHCLWPTHDGVEIEAENVEAALLHALAEAKCLGDSCDEYECGDVLHVQVWESNGTVHQGNVALDKGLVQVEVMPEWLKASHAAAGNWGVYPHNGAVRQWVTPEEADDLENSEEYFLRL